jgi:hypothetical protein
MGACSQKIAVGIGKNPFDTGKNPEELFTVSHGMENAGLLRPVRRIGWRVHTKPCKWEKSPVRRSLKHPTTTSA